MPVLPRFMCMTFVKRFATLRFIAWDVNPSCTSELKAAKRLAIGMGKPPWMQRPRLLLKPLVLIT